MERIDMMIMEGSYEQVGGGSGSGGKSHPLFHNIIIFSTRIFLGEHK